MNSTHNNMREDPIQLTIKQWDRQFKVDIN